MDNGWRTNYYSCGFVLLQFYFYIRLVSVLSYFNHIVVSTRRDPLAIWTKPNTVDCRVVSLVAKDTPFLPYIPHLKKDKQNRC